MKLLLTILACLVAASAGAQTVKSLSYNTTNGQVVYSGTNRLTFTNSLLVASQTGSVLSVGTTNVQIRRDPGSGSLIFTANGNTNTFEFLSSGTLRLSGPLSFDATTNALGYAATTRTNLGGTTVGNALFTAATTNAARVALGATVVGENIFTVPLQYQELFLRINADNTVSSLSPAATRTNLGLGATNNVTFSNITASGTLAVTGNVTLSGVNNTMPGATNAASASSLMTRGLSDARYSPMPMTPQIIPWFYNGTIGVTRVTNGSATLGTSAAFPSITTTTNAADSGAMIMLFEVWGSLNSANNPWNAIGRSVILQGRFGATATNAVARFVYSSSTNWPTLMTNVGGISNLGWAVETRYNGSNEARLIVNGATNISVSDWTAIGFDPANDSSFMVVPCSGFTSLYWAATAEAFTRTPLITVTNQLGGSVAGAALGGLGFSVVNTNTASGNSIIYIRRCYQVLGMTNYGY